MTTSSKPATPPNSFDRRDAALRAATIDPVKEIKDGRDTTRATPKWDRFLASKEAEGGGNFAAALKQHGKSAAWAAYARETFAKLYDSGLSKDLPEGERPLGSDWVQKLHESAEALPEWRALRERSRRDSWAAGIAAGEALNVLAQQVTPPDADPQRIQDELEFIQQLMADKGGKTSAKHLRRLAALQRQKAEALEEHGRAVTNIANRASSLRSAMRGAMQAAQSKISEMDEAMNTMGAGEGSGLTSRISCPPAQLRSALAKNDKLRRIAKLAGRMKSAALQKQRTKAKHGHEELCDVKQGSDVARLVPSELINFATEETEMLLFGRIIDNAAMCYELRGKENRSEGPIIMAVDESGSMSGTRDEWAKAVAFALMEIAARQNRAFAYVHYDSRVSRTDRVENPKALSLEQIENFVSYFTGGGTNIANALNHCVKMLEEAAAGRADKPWKRADVILVTDGEDYGVDAQKKAIAKIKELNGHVYGIFIGCSAEGELAKMCDETVGISGQIVQKGDPNALGELFAI